MRRFIAMILLCLCHGYCVGQVAEKKAEPPPPPEFSVLGGYHRLRPMKIKPAALTPAATRLADPLSLQDALRTLYPGYLYRVPDPNMPADTFTLAEWHCPACPPKKVSGWITGEKLRFPLADDNQTRWKDSVYFTDDSGQRNVFISFSTTPDLESEDFIPSGRFACAFMGLAWFTLRGSEWHLRAFSPVVGCFGAFQTLPAIAAMRLGHNNYGCVLTNANGAPAGPYYGHMYVFAAIKQQFQTVLTVDRLERRNVVTSAWSGQLSTLGNDTKTGFDDLRVQITGDYRKADFTAGDDPQNVPVELRSPAVTRDSCVFKVSRVYRFDKGRYNKVSSTVDLD